MLENRRNMVDCMHLILCTKQVPGQHDGTSDVGGCVGSERDASIGPLAAARVNTTTSSPDDQCLMAYFELTSQDPYVRMYLEFRANRPGDVTHPNTNMFLPRTVAGGWRRAAASNQLG
jgi:hypothetical protein